MEVKLHHRQTLAWQALHDPKILEVMFGGAKFGGKSWLGCEWMYCEAREIARKYVPEPRKHPIPIGFMGRKIGKDFTETTLETWKRWIPNEGIKIVGKPSSIIINGRVKIFTGGLDRREDVSKFNSAEFARIWIDQAEECTEDDVNVLRATTSLVGRLIIDGKHIPGKILYTANPASCWLKPAFIDNPAPNQVFVQSLPGDNPHCPPEYIDHLKHIFRHRPELIEAYVYGSWDSVEAADQVIKGMWLRQVEHREIHWPNVRKIITADVARYGDDETVIYVIENTAIIEQEIMSQSSTHETASKINTLYHKHGKPTVVVETTGGDLGAGVIDDLTAWDVDVISYYPDGAAINKEIYGNQRAAVWDGVAKSLADGEIADEELPQDLKTQLCSVRYKFKHGRLFIEPKEDVKQRLSRSPDQADAWIQGQYYLQFVEPEVEEKVDYDRHWRRKKSVAPESPMIM